MTGGLSNMSFGLPNRKLLKTRSSPWPWTRAWTRGSRPGLARPRSGRGRSTGQPTLPARRGRPDGVDVFAVEYLVAHRAGELSKA